MKEKGKIHYAWWILIGCCMIQMMTLGVIVNAGGIYFLEIVRDFQAHGKTIAISDLSLFYTAQSLAIVVGLSLANPLMKRFNLRVLMTVGLLMMVVAQGAMAFYHHAPLWGVSGLLFGVAVPVVGIIPPTVMLMNWFQQKQGTVIAIQSAFGGIGGAIMNPVVEQLIQQFGWRSTYLITAVLIALTVLPFTLFVFRMTPGEMGMRAFDSNERVPLEKEMPVGELELPGVTVQQAKQTPAFWFLMLAMVCIGYLMSFMQFLKPYAVTINWDSLGATMTSFAMLGSLSGNLLVGSLADRFGIRKVHPASSLAIAAGLILLIVGRSHAVLLLAGSLLYGMNQGLSMVGTPLLIRESFGSKDYANIFSRLSRVQSIIGAVGFYGISKLAETFGTPTMPDYTPTLVAGVGIGLTLAIVVAAALRQAPMLRKTTRVEVAVGMAKAGEELYIEE